MTNWETRQRRKQDVKARAASPNHMYAYCRVPGCSRSAKAGTGKGLDTRYCRKHADHYNRHGDPMKGSYPASVINPFRKKSRAWLREHKGDVAVQQAVVGIRELYWRAGLHIEAFRLRGLPPRKRAWAAWARLRKAEVDPIEPLVAWLAVEMAIANDPQPVRSAEYKRVQAAKIVHRMASGSHKRWEQELQHPSDTFRKIKHVQELHVYPQSRGRVLRFIGGDLEKAAGPLHGVMSGTGG